MTGARRQGARSTTVSAVGRAKALPLSGVGRRAGLKPGLRVVERKAWDVAAGLMSKGATYSFILNGNEESGWYDGAPFGRFVLDSRGRLQPVAEVWADLPAVQALSGLSPDEAAHAISTAAAAP